MSTALDDLRPVLLPDIKNYLDLTWADDKMDAKIWDIATGGMAYLNGKIGDEQDYTLPGLARSLLLDYIRYARDGAADIFENNYRQLTPKVTLRYEEKRLGINRLYLSRENMAEIVRVIRVPRPAVAISSQDVAQTEDGQKYRIDTVQAVEDCWPPALDLSLRAVEADFDRRLEDDSNGVV